VFTNRFYPLASADPALFLARIHGNTPTKTDSKKNDVNVAFNRDKSDTNKSTPKPKPARRELRKHWSRAAGADF
jgi:hypothetical protein